MNEQLPPPPDGASPPVDPKEAKKADRAAKKAERNARYEAKKAEREAKYEEDKARREARGVERKAQYEADKAERRAQYEADKAERRAEYDRVRAERDASAAERKAVREAEASKRAAAQEEHRAQATFAKTEIGASVASTKASLAEYRAEREAAREAKNRAKEEKERSRTEKELAKKPRYLKESASGFGVTVKNGEIRHGGDRGPLAGASARVESAGEIRERFTLTRLALLGTFGLALKKKNDKRELYLTVEGEGFAFVEEIDPDKSKKAREFAAELTGLGSKASLEEAERSAKRAALATRPVSSAGQASSLNGDVASKLAELASLHQAGALTDDEFAAAKTQLLH